MKKDPARTPLPTEEEMHQWYTSIRETPGAYTLRAQVLSEVPKYRTIVTGIRSYRATRHGTLDSQSALCGLPLTSPETLDSKYDPVRCHTCLKIIKHEGYEEAE